MRLTASQGLLASAGADIDMESSLSREFFLRPTTAVARDLLGVWLWRRLDDGSLLHGPIVECEAYTEDDPACHAFRGRTRRCEVMFGPAGHAYVYFIYGMYNCLNVVTEPDGTPGAVLIRAVAAENTDGPGKLCREWAIDRSYNGSDLLIPGSDLWLGEGVRLPDELVEITPRIGISVAVDRPWRFAVKDHPSVSGPRVVKPGKAGRRRRKSDDKEKRR